jgi:hypothetical protein
MPHQIFLSYAWADDEVPAVERERPGWVRYFHDFVVAGLRSRGFKDVNFWRDVKEYSDNQEFEKQIEAALANAVLLVAIVSPNYLSSQWCPKELARFIDRIRGPNGVLERERVVKILKYTVKEEELHNVFSGRRGFRFFDDSQKEKVAVYYDFGRVMRQEYFTIVEEVVEELRRILERPWPANDPGDSPASGPGEIADTKTAITTFLARPSRDRREEYIKLAEELKRRGARVVPDPRDSLPEEANELKAVLGAALGEAKLSLHLLGANLGVTPEGGDEPLVSIQLKLGAERARSQPDFRRFIWIPPDLAADEPTKRLIEGLRDGRMLLPDDELIEEPFERLKETVVGQLTKTAPPPKPVQREAEAPPRVYVACRPGDVWLAKRAVVQPLFSAGLDPCPPLGQSALQPERDRHEARELTGCDSVIVLWGEGDEAWCRDLLWRLRNRTALGRERPFRSLVLLIAPPLTEEKEGFLTRDADLILDATAGFDPAEKRFAAADLDRLVASLKEKGS